MPRKLKKLKITHVAVCRQGANYDPETQEGAHILLFKSEDAPLDKQEGVTVGDVYTDTPAGSSTCTDEACHALDCPVHGLRNQLLQRSRRKKKRVAKGPVSEMGTHAEPDGDESPPLDYRTRGQQYDLWEELWGKWECFCTTFYDVIGDGDEDNVPHLPILVDSIGQFQEDVAQLLEDCGIAKEALPLLADVRRCLEWSSVDKAGVAMAGHRRKRLQDAIAALQQILEECTPDDLPHGVNPSPDRAGVSAAEVRGFAGYMVKGEESMSETLESVTKRAEQAEAQVEALTKTLAETDARVKELEPLAVKVAQLEDALESMKLTPEEQIAKHWASQPEAVRKAHEADEAEKVELRKQLSDARAEREQTVYIAKAQEFRGFGLAPQKHWTILKSIDGMPEEDRTELLRLMQAATEQLRTSDLFKAAGSDGHNGSAQSSSAEDELFTRTQAYAEEHGLSFQKAADVIAKKHPDLYRRADDERRRAHRVRTE